MKSAYYVHGWASQVQVWASTKLGVSSPKKEVRLIFPDSLVFGWLRRGFFKFYLKENPWMGFHCTSANKRSLPHAFMIMFELLPQAGISPRSEWSREIEIDGGGSAETRPIFSQPPTHFQVFFLLLFLLLEVKVNVVTSARKKSQRANLIETRPVSSAKGLSSSSTPPRLLSYYTLVIQSLKGFPDKIETDAYVVALQVGAYML